MKSKLTLCIPALLFQILMFGQIQELKVYHGTGSTTQVYDASGQTVANRKIRLNEGDVFTVTVVNPNPAFYTYKLKTEELEIKTEDKAITDLLTVFGSIVSARQNALLQPNTVQYKDVLNDLLDSINKAKRIIIRSDVPETPAQALATDPNAGFRLAVSKIRQMDNSQYHFNNPNLLNDLNALVDKVGNDEFEKEAYRLLNASLVDKINEIKKQTNASVATVWKKDFTVGEKPTKISLEIEQTDKTNATLIRDGHGASAFKIDVAQIEPFFKRAVLELVPVANFVFAGGYKEFYLENSIVQSRERNKTTVNPGLVLNVNFARFGEAREMAVGIGPGFKFNKAEDSLENFYLSALFSYKNFLRVGAGFGFSQVPREELEGGVKTGDTLPDDIANLDDLIQYVEKPSVFLTISFTGLNLTKKK